MPGRYYLTLAGRGFDASWGFDSRLVGALDRCQHAILHMPDMTRSGRTHTLSFLVVLELTCDWRCTGPWKVMDLFVLYQSECYINRILIYINWWWTAYPVSCCDLQCTVSVPFFSRLFRYEAFYLYPCIFMFAIDLCSKHNIQVGNYELAPSSAPRGS